MWLVLIFGCAPEPTTPAWSFPDPAARPVPRGPGGPERAFAGDELFARCAFLPGPPEDRGHRNTVVPWRGHLIVPWAHEVGFGGLSFWEMDDPCQPVHATYGFHLNMRETHALGMVHLPPGDPHAGDYAVAAGTQGLVFWDMTDLSDVKASHYLMLDGVISLDSYARTPLFNVWQYPYVYVAATDNGLIVVDATDPYAPFEVARLQLDPLLRMGTVQVFGTLGLVVSAGEREAAVLDLSDPLDPQLVRRFEITDGEGTPREAYSGTMVGHHAWFARKDQGSGPIAFDLSDPANPVFASEVVVSESGGGYVFLDEGRAFIGQGNRADVYDFRDLTNPIHVGRGDLEGDLDTLTPFGNVAVLAVDDEGVPGEEMAVMPWDASPDRTAPTVLGLMPPDGATGVATTARLGVAFDEMIEPSSVFPGSVRLEGPDGPVRGWAGAHETYGWYTPREPLAPNTTYTLTVLAGGVVDVNGNAVASDVRATFTTGAR